MVWLWGTSWHSRNHTVLTVGNTSAKIPWDVTTQRHDLGAPARAGFHSNRSEKQPWSPHKLGNASREVIHHGDPYFPFNGTKPLRHRESRALADRWATQALSVKVPATHHTPKRHHLQAAVFWGFPVPLPWASGRDLTRRQVTCKVFKSLIWYDTVSAANHGEFDWGMKEMEIGVRADRMS